MHRRFSAASYLFAISFLLSLSTTLFSATTSVANPTSSLHVALRDLCSGVTGTVPSISMLMVLAGSAIYASGQVMGSETRARSNVWATAALTGAVTGLLISTITPGVLATIYGADVDCSASGSHGSFAMCGQSVGDTCCASGACGSGMFCDATNHCSNNCGNSNGAACCPGNWCGNAPGLYCTGATCSNNCGTQSLHCCDTPACKTAGLICDASQTCQGCGVLNQPCCTSGEPCNTSITPRIACNTSAGTSGTCQACGTAIGSLCCANNPACSPAGSTCNFGTVPSTCAACGGANQLCCGSTCNTPWYSCQSSYCKHCGNETESCCTGASGAVLSPPNDCNNSSIIRPLACQGSICVYQAPICGDVNELCCATTPACGASQFCNTSLYCQHCGLASEHCCYNATSASYNNCSSGFACNTTAAIPTCYACGGIGNQCCWNSTASDYNICTAGGAFCNATKKCQACGTDGVACCQPNNQCPTQGSQNLSCNITATPTCYNCGGQNQICCGGMGGSCNEPYKCNATGSCAACGLKAGDPCCTGNLCVQGTSQNLTCNSTAPATPPYLCINCGATGQACCPTNICNGASTCVSSLCYANCTLGAPITSACACQGALHTANSGYCSYTNKFYALLPTCSALTVISGNDPTTTEQPCVCNSTAQPPVPVPAANGKYCCNGVIQATACSPTCTPGSFIGSTACICQGALRTANTGYCSYKNTYQATLPVCSGAIAAGNSPTTNETPCTCGGTANANIYTAGTCCANTYTSTSTTCCADGATGTCKCGTGAVCTTSQTCSLSTNTCTSKCTQNSNCQAGYYCRASDQTCVATIANRAPCSYVNTYSKTGSEVHGQCASGYCRDWISNGNGNGACESGETCSCAPDSTSCMDSSGSTSSGTQSCQSTRYSLVCSSGAWARTDCYASNYCGGSGSSTTGLCTLYNYTCSSGACQPTGQSVASGSVCIGSTIYAGSISSGYYSSKTSNTCGSSNNVVATYYACASGSATGVALSPNPYTVQTCTSGSQTCSGGTCVACGQAVGQACCSSGITCNPSSLECFTTSTTCIHCGATNEPCCGSDSTCTQGYAMISINGGYAMACGSPTTCASGNVCGSSDSICHACGDYNEPCCSGSSCNSPNNCVSGTCLQCGASGYPCCGGAGGSCASGLSCNNNAVCYSRTISTYPGSTATCGVLLGPCCPSYLGFDACPSNGVCRSWTYPTGVCCPSNPGYC